MYSVVHRSLKGFMYCVKQVGQMQNLKELDISINGLVFLVWEILWYWIDILIFHFKRRIKKGGFICYSSKNFQFKRWVSFFSPYREIDGRDFVEPFDITAFSRCLRKYFKNLEQFEFKSFPYVHFWTLTFQNLTIIVSKLKELLIGRLLKSFLIWYRMDTIWKSWILRF